MKKAVGLLLAGALILTVLGCAGAYYKPDESEETLESAVSSYYAGQNDRAFRMLNKSIFKKLLKNGWLENLEGIQNARWNYDTFTAYTVLDQDPALPEKALYCCTFSADDDRCGYLVLLYDGDGLGRVRAVETPALYDFQANVDTIQEELHRTGLDPSSTAASRVGFRDEQGAWVEGVLFKDGEGNKWIYQF